MRRQRTPFQIVSGPAINTQNQSASHHSEVFFIRESRLGWTERPNLYAGWCWTLYLDADIGGVRGGGEGGDR